MTAKREAEEDWPRLVADGDGPADLSGTGDYDELHLYLSGGGLQAALAALGVIFFLNDPWAGPGAWEKVTRVASVSGGSLTNATLATASDLQSFYPAVMWRLSSRGRYVIGLAGLVPCVALVLWLVQRWPSISPISDDVCPRGVCYGTAANSVLSLALSLILIFAVVGVFQVAATLYLRSRVAAIVEPPLGPGLGLLHAFSATDLRSGQPAHVIYRCSNGKTRTLLALDARTVDNAVTFHEGDGITLRQAVYASVAWPVIALPQLIRLRNARSRKGEDESHRPFTTEPTLAQVAGDHGSIKQANRSWFALMDGGLAGTLGSQLDPSLQRLDGKRGVMQVVGLPHSKADSNRIRRVVVDGAKYNNSRHSWLFKVLPGASSLATTKAAITLALDQQVTLGRALANNQSSIWYIPVTGAGRQFFFRRRSFDERNVIRSPLSQRSTVKPSIEAVEDQRLGRGSTTPDNNGDDTLEVIDSIVLELQQRIDRVGYFPTPWNRKRYVAGGAAGVAAAFAEAQGLGENLEELRALLERYQRAVLQKGAINDVLSPAFEQHVREGKPSAREDRAQHRWPEVGAFHHPRRGSSSPFPMSHRGDTSGDADDNTLEAFKLAYANGYRLLECDVQLTKDNHLVAFHDTKVTSEGTKRRVKDLTLQELQAATIQHTSLVSDLILHFAETSVRWNFEAKTTRSMSALLVEIATQRDYGHLTGPSDILLSGGGKHRVLRHARLKYPDLLTAASLRESIRLFFGVPTYHVAVVQLPYRYWKVPLSWLMSPIARQARRQGIQTIWWNVNRRADALRVLRRDPGIGIATDAHDMLTNVLGWENPDSSTPAA